MSSDEEYISSDEEQPTRRQNRSQRRSQPAEDVDEIARREGELLAKQLIHTHSLRIIPRKTDLMPANRADRKHWNLIKQHADRLIGRVFGYSILEVSSEREVVLLLVESEPLEANDHLDNESRRQQVLLFLVLGYLTLKGPPVTEAALFGFLDKLGILTDGSAFGDVKETLTKDFPAKFYLKRIKEDDAATGEKSFRYDWGARSAAEVDKDMLLNEFSAILGKPVRSFAQANQPNVVEA